MQFIQHFQKISVAPCLAGQATPAEQAQRANVGYSTITRWLREFRERGLPGLFPVAEYPREPYTAEWAIVLLLYFKCCAPQATHRELARVVATLTGERLHHETVKALLERYLFWRHPEFQKQIQYPRPAEPQARRLEMVKLQQQGWSKKSIACLLRTTPKTVNKWLRRHKYEQTQAQPTDAQLWLLDRSHVPHQPPRKVYLGAIHAVLTLQKKTKSTPQTARQLRFYWGPELVKRAG